MQSLRAWNYGAAAVHLAAAASSYFLLDAKSAEKRTVQTVRLAYKDVSSENASRVDIPVDIEDSSRIDLKFVVVLFFAITSLFHLLYATDFFGRGWYSSQILGFGWNPYRWLEYSLSASLMIYLISVVSGTKDNVSAISAALITPGLMINGFTTERALRQNALHDWSVSSRAVDFFSSEGSPRKASKPEIDTQIVISNLVPAWLLYGVHWYIILSNYTKLYKEAQAAGNTLDKSVTFMVFSQLAFFSLFGVIQTYQVLRMLTSHEGREEPSYIIYEKTYIVLSAVTKILLAGTVAYALRN